MNYVYLVSYFYSDGSQYEPYEFEQHIGVARTLESAKNLIRKTLAKGLSSGYENREDFDPTDYNDTEFIYDEKRGDGLYRFDDYDGYDYRVFTVDKLQYID